MSKKHLTSARLMIFVILFIIIFLIQPKAMACPDPKPGLVESGGCFTHYVTGNSLFLNLIIIAVVSYFFSVLIRRLFVGNEMRG